MGQDGRFVNGRLESDWGFICAGLNKHGLKSYIFGSLVWKFLLNRAWVVFLEL